MSHYRLIKHEMCQWGTTTPVWLLKVDSCSAKFLFRPGQARFARSVQSGAADLTERRVPMASRNARGLTPRTGLADPARRDFLKVAGTLTAGAVLGAPTRAWAAADKKIRIGYISPKTGPFAPFAEADDFILEQVRRTLAGGLSAGGTTYEVEILSRDDQSSPDRQSNLAAELINKDNVDLMLAQVSIGPGVSQQCELNGVPCLSTNTPWQAWMFPMKGDPAKGFKNAFHFFWGIEDIAAVYLDIWKGAKTNKVVGSVFSNDVPGTAMGDLKLGLPGAFANAGYKIIDRENREIGRAHV